tara:strand:+ start:325 stop:906 length:582 start_codon:yes stop_codon:yes gene_type:complete
MKKLTNEDLLTLEEYDTNRESIKTEVIKAKKHRSINIGSNIVLLFESFETIKYQVQEMLRIEKIFKKEEVQDEISAYQALIPDGNNFKATMLIMYPDVEERRKMLEKLNGVENKMWVSIDQSSKIYAKADEDLDRANDKKTSAVHFLRYQLSNEEVDLFKNSKNIEFGVDHDEYSTTIKITSDTYQSLLSDLD